MVGRFNVRPGDGADGDWLVWDNAMNGHRGRCASEVEANALAADLELQYTVHGPRDQTDVRRRGGRRERQSWGTAIRL